MIPALNSTIPELRNNAIKELSCLYSFQEALNGYIFWCVRQNINLKCFEANLDDLSVRNYISITLLGSSVKYAV